MPLWPVLVERLTAWQQAAPTGVPYVFVTLERYVEVKAAGFKLKKCSRLLNGVLKQFVAIRRRAGILEGCLHDLRRTCITNWLRCPDLTPPDVQILAGHESIETTLKNYAEVTESKAVERARKVGVAPADGLIPARLDSPPGGL